MYRSVIEHSIFTREAFSKSQIIDPYEEPYLCVTSSWDKNGSRWNGVISVWLIDGDCIEPVHNFKVAEQDPISKINREILDICSKETNIEDAIIAIKRLG